MELQKPKIALYAKRSFGDKLNASFEFIKENWKPLLKFSTYLILPISLIQGLSLNGLMGGVFNLSQIAQASVGANGLDPTSMGMMFFVHYIAYLILYILGTILMSSVVYALIQKYNESEERLQGITMAVLKPLLIRNIKRMIGLSLVCIVFVLLACIVVGVLTVATPFTLVLTIPLLIACFVPLALLGPIYLFENISVMNVFKKTFRLGFATWGGILLISIIMGLIASVLQGVTTTPWYIATLVKYFFSMSENGDTTTVSMGYNFLLYLLSIIQVYGAYLSMIFTLIGMAYQYGHASEVVDSITVEEDIDNFDKLK